jgi:hypothetical protein
MRTLIQVLVLSMAVALQAAAQTRRTTDIGPSTTGRYNLLGGETVGNGVNVVSGEFGWPSVSFGVTHGLSRDTDVGAKFDLLFGLEGDTQASQFGIGFRVPYRMVALRSDRLSVLLHVDPGIKLFTTSPATFGFGFPVGAVFGYAATRDVTVGFGVDLNMALYVTPSPVQFVISPIFGPAVEFHVDPRLAVGINTRFGPVIYTNGGATDFGFVTQLLLAYRM